MLQTKETRPGARNSKAGNDQAAAPIHTRVYSARDLCHWYTLGVQHERERAAGAWYELDTSWTRSGAEVAASRYAEMMQTFEQAAQRFHEVELGRSYIPFEGVQP